MNCLTVNDLADGNYCFVKDVLDATHWIAKPDSKSTIKDYIIPNKIYEVINHDYILSEDGNLTTYWMCHKGNFIKMRKDS